MRLLPIVCFKCFRPIIGGSYTIPIAPVDQILCELCARSTADGDKKDRAFAEEMRR